MKRFTLKINATFIIVLIASTSFGCAGLGAMSSLASMMKLSDDVGVDTASRGWQTQPGSQPDQYADASYLYGVWKPE